MFQRPQPLRVNIRDDMAVPLEVWLEKAFERCSRARALRCQRCDWSSASSAVHGRLKGGLEIQGEIEL